jgi:hypothetical protein
MALWGNNDNVGSIGTVSLDYSNRVVSGWAGTATGLGVSFGETGYAQAGDIISFGQHGSGTYYGDAVIASIGSTLQLTIASTCGLIGGGITGVNYTISQKPTWIPADSHYSAEAEAPSIQTLTTGTAEFAAGIGSIAIPTDISAISPPVQIGDYLVNNSDNFEIIAIGLCTSRVLATVDPGDYVIRTISPDFLVSGETTVGLGTTQSIIAGAGETTALTSSSVSSATVVPLTNGNKYNAMVGDVVNLPGLANKTVSAVGTNQVTLSGAVSLASGVAVTFVSDTINIIDTPASGDYTLGVGDTLTWQGDAGTPGDVICLDQGVTAAISADDTLTFRRVSDGYDAYVYGVNQSGVATATQYATNAGWVGVTTYIDNLGNLRIKKETLVAMSGITTGNVPAYPPT